MRLLAKLFGNKKTTAPGKIDLKATIEIKEPEIPPFQGDYAKAVFLNAVAKSTPVKSKSEYVQYLLYECGIKKPEKYHQQMIKEGYLQESTIEDMVTALKTDTLREILKRLGLPVSGVKASLIDRIIKAEKNEIVQEYFKTQTYALSEKGKQFLEEHNSYLLLHKNPKWGIEWKEFDRCHRDGQGFYEVVWDILNRRVKNEPTFGLMRNDYYYMYQVLCQEGKREQALEMLLRVMYMDISGTSGMQFWRVLTSGMHEKDEIFNSYNIAVMIAPGLRKEMKQFKDIFDSAMIEKVYKYDLPFCCCDQKTFLYVISSILDGTYDEEVVYCKLKPVYDKMIAERLGIE